jgi:hypothetical protein
MGSGSGWVDELRPCARASRSRRRCRLEVVPLAASGSRTAIVSVFLPVLAIICLVLIVSRSLWAIIAIMIALILGLIALVLRLEYPSPFTNWFETTAEILTRTALLWVVAVAVFQTGRVTHHRVEGAIVLYFNVALIFSALYRLGAQMRPTAFTGLPATATEIESMATMIYFSFTTLTSVGFGDIVPAHPFARSLVNGVHPLSETRESGQVGGGLNRPAIMHDSRSPYREFVGPLKTVPDLPRLRRV